MMVVEANLFIICRFPKSRFDKSHMIYRHWILILLLAPVAASAEPQKDTAWEPLWNGKNFDGWTTWLQQPNRNSVVPGVARDAEGKYTETVGLNKDPLKVFQVVTLDNEPAIRISGEIFGELRSQKSLGNYHLKLEFKWGETKWPPRDKAETPRDSGLLYHMHGDAQAEKRNWSRSIELQIQERDCGDLYAVGTAIAVRARYDKSLKFPEYIYDPTGTWTYFSQIPGQTGRCIKSPDAEKPHGTWNTIELICLDQEAIHIVNGQVVMRLHGPMRIDGKSPESITSGPIILQSEGAEIFYRNITFRSIQSIPEAYR